MEKTIVDRLDMMTMKLEYREKLTYRARKQEQQLTIHTYDIPEDGVKVPIRAMKAGKLPGSDCISMEVVKTETVVTKILVILTS